MARCGEYFGMRVLLGQLPGRPAREDRLPLHELLPQVDALSLHCPLNEHTQGLIGAEELRLMKPQAFLINTARGGLVDEQALADALRAGHLGGAACDVLTQEPPKDGNPLLPGIDLRAQAKWKATVCNQHTPPALCERGSRDVQSVMIPRARALAVCFAGPGCGMGRPRTR